jgi:RNA polymerase sigma-70 factor (ECF subfamily)
MMNDETLIAAVAAGDHMALKTLFERHAPWLARRLRRSLPADVVEDVLQETFIAVWRNAGRYQGRADVGGWVWGVARRQTALWYRKNNRPVPVLDQFADPDPATVATIRADINTAMATLTSQDQQQLARMVFIEERSIAEIAEVFDIPRGTVKSRVFHLRRKLQQALGRES